MSEANTCPCGRVPAIYGTHGPRLCAGCDADYDAVLETVLGDDFSAADTLPAPADEDESRPCISDEITGCGARIQPRESADPDGDVAVCSDCYGEGRVWQ